MPSQTVQTVYGLNSIFTNKDTNNISNSVTNNITDNTDNETDLDTVQRHDTFTTETNSHYSNKCKIRSNSIDLFTPRSLNIH